MGYVHLQAAQYPGVVLVLEIALFHPQKLAEGLVEYAKKRLIVHVYEQPCLDHLHPLVQQHQQRQRRHRPAEHRQVPGQHTLVGDLLNDKGL